MMAGHLFACHPELMVVAVALPVVPVPVAPVPVASVPVAAAAIACAVDKINGISIMQLIVSWFIPHSCCRIFFHYLSLSQRTSFVHSLTSLVKSLPQRILTTCVT